MKAYITLIPSCHHGGKYQAPLPSEHGLAYGRWAYSGLSTLLNAGHCPVSSNQSPISFPISIILSRACSLELLFSRVSLFQLIPSFCLGRHKFPLFPMFASCTIPAPNMHSCRVVMLTRGGGLHIFLEIVLLCMPMLQDHKTCSRYHYPAPNS